MIVFSKNRVFQNPQIIFLSLALLAVSTTFIGAKYPFQKPTYDFLFIVDITQSMNTRDYRVEGLPSDRLSFVKHALRSSLPEIPCGSNIGLGVFSNKQTLVLIDSVEVCENFSILDNILSHIDWRMAWAAESNIRRGLYTSMLRATRISGKPHLIFLTDGETTIADYRAAPLERISGQVTGLIIGIGGPFSSPIPKLDQRNILSGYWKPEEITLFKDQSGYRVNQDGYYLSTVDESNLRNLASLSGLQYRRLETPEQLMQFMLKDQFATEKRVMVDVRWVFALAALVLVALIYLPFLRRGVDHA